MGLGRGGITPGRVVCVCVCGGGEDAYKNFLSTNSILSLLSFSLLVFPPSLQ